MSVARCLEINARLRAAGITVHEWPGWQSRGNGLASAYEGCIVHHTASPFGFAYQTLVDGRTDLDGPLCNYAGNEDGSLTIIAAHPANHAGASGGKSMGPLPVTRLFNPKVMGLEIVYPGTERMRDAQYHSACAWSRTTTDVLGYGDIERARAHFETSVTGKIDIAWSVTPVRSYDMTRFRADARAVLLEATMAITPSDADVILDRPRQRHDAPSLNSSLGGIVAYYDEHRIAAQQQRNNIQATQAAHGQALAQLLSLHGAPPNAADAAEVWARIESAAASAAEKGAKDGLVDTVLPALAELAAKLDADDAEQARAGAREVLAQLRNSLPAA
jgi:hypothetical protein